MLHMWGLVAQLARVGSWTGLDPDKNWSKIKKQLSAICTHCDEMPRAAGSESRENGIALWAKSLFLMRVYEYFTVKRPEYILLVQFPTVVPFK